MGKIDFNTITDAQPEKVYDRVWRIRCYTKDGNPHVYPFTYGTQHAAKREAARIVEIASKGGIQ